MNTTIKAILQVYQLDRGSESNNVVRFTATLV